MTDAERYQYIRKVLMEAIADNPHIAGIYLTPPSKKYWFETQQDIDDAIDEAMRGENKTNAWKHN